MSISAVIIAGGKSSRMGQDKALMPFGKYSTLSEYQYRRLEYIFDNVYISAKDNKFPFKANIIYDTDLKSNPLNAIKSAFEQLKDDAIFILSVDMPLLSINSINKLLNAYKNSDNRVLAITIKSKSNFEPTATIYKREVLETINKMYQKGDFKLLNILNSVKILSIEVNEDELININRPQDYKKAKELIT